MRDAFYTFSYQLLQFWQKHFLKNRLEIQTSSLLWNVYHLHDLFHHTNTISSTYDETLRIRSSATDTTLHIFIYFTIFEDHPIRKIEQLGKIALLVPKIIGKFPVQIFSRFQNMFWFCYYENKDTKNVSQLINVFQIIFPLIDIFKHKSLLGEWVCYVLCVLFV